MRSRARIALVLLGIAGSALAATACTMISGVDDLEVRGSAAPPTNAADGGAPSGDASSPPSLVAPDAGRDGSSAGPSTGPALCGAAGSWSTCEPTNAATTCKQLCAARGQTCVENCCMYDSEGDYAARAGAVYLAASLGCGFTSMPANAFAGACNDPAAPLFPVGDAVSCCCR